MAKEKEDNRMEQQSLTAALLKKYLINAEDAEKLLEELHDIAKKIYDDTRYSVGKLLSAAAQELEDIPLPGLKYHKENLRLKLEHAMKSAVGKSSSSCSNKKVMPVYTGRNRPPPSPFEHRVGHRGKHRRKKSLGG